MIREMKKPDYIFVINSLDIASARNNIFFVAYSYMGIEENENAILLWSHYADKHKGLAFCFDFPEDMVGVINLFLQ